MFDYGVNASIILALKPKTSSGKIINIVARRVLAFPPKQPPVMRRLLRQRIAK
jgi:hypothetical protein